MGNILLIVIMLAIFAFGYSVVDRFGRFMDENSRRYREPEEPDRKVFITETKGKSAKEISKEISSMLGSLQDCGDYEIIICKKADLHIIEYLENSGYTVRYGSRQ